MAIICLTWLTWNLGSDFPSYSVNFGCTNFSSGFIPLFSWENGVWYLRTGSFCTNTSAQTIDPAKMVVLPCTVAVRLLSFSLRSPSQFLLALSVSLRSTLDWALRGETLHLLNATDLLSPWLSRNMRGLPSGLTVARIVMSCDAISNDLANAYSRFAIDDTNCGDVSLMNDGRKIEDRHTYGGPAVAKGADTSWLHNDALAINRNIASRPSSSTVIIPNLINSDSPEVTIALSRTVLVISSVCVELRRRGPLHLLHSDNSAEASALARPDSVIIRYNFRLCIVTMTKAAPEQVEATTFTMPCDGQAFNAINGPSFTWTNIWPATGLKFGVKVPNNMFSTEFVFSKELGDKGGVWREIVEEEGLVQTEMEDLANWEFLDMLFRCQVKMLGTREKADRLGYTTKCNTLESVLYWIDNMREEKLIP
ncbi:NAD(P)-binding Rossmann-fold superfamily protein [Actinidia rufa]|uniref:NAD(P)-binding Rossmann-fold superfamily protein n=1 Tax=Actinidia rufa TaxID=165716 RepID=A0A7J0FSF2_9ERIC|nr:NAD(P)-binding Rossmann-fold superfamily protein [Actinidia rufa]